MGRRPWSYRHTVEQCRAIDIPWLSRHRYLSGGLYAGTIEWRNAASEVTGSIGIQVSVNSIDYGTSYVRLIYTQTNTVTKEKMDLDYTIELVTTPCNFGGVRYWFICPLFVNGRHCGRRIGKLYLPPGATYFGCRHCHNLTYQCQKEHNKRMDVLLKHPELLLSEAGAVGFKSLSKALKVLLRIQSGSWSGQTGSRSCAGTERRSWSFTQVYPALNS